MRATVAGTRRFARARSLAASLATGAVAVLLGWGCAAHRAVPPKEIGPPTLKRAPAAGYDGRRDSLDSVDARVLRGRRIVLDPGHGGFFPGTIGVGGLTEKEVNLGVALELRALLVAGGAEVTMTRETDRDFLSPADSSLRADLAARVAIANGAAPDLFVSVHHNADPGGLHDVNETQTYYQLGDEGPSYDAAQDVYRALARNLGIEVTKMIPGNFFVVRNAESPALLTEVSYLTYPPTEEKLRTPAARKLEAEALYLGITRWFMRHAPRLSSFAALDAAGLADTAFTATPRLAAQIDGAFDAATMRIDGRPVPTMVTGGRIEWSGAPPLAGGVHEASFSARFAGEGASRSRRLRFHLSKPPARVELELQARRSRPRAACSPCARGCWTATGFRWRTASPLRLSSIPRGSFVPAETTVHVRDGEAWGYLTRSRRVNTTTAARATVAGASSVHVSPAVGPAKASPQDARALTRTGFARRFPGDSALVLSPAARPRWLNRDGFLSLPLDAAGAAAIPRLAGFRRVDEDSLVAAAVRGRGGRRAPRPPDRARPRGRRRRRRGQWPGRHAGLGAEPRGGARALRHARGRGRVGGDDARGGPRGERVGARAGRGSVPRRALPAHRPRQCRPHGRPLLQQRWRQALGAADFISPRLARAR
jgi:N-acetylmuramoyl-L-alanine amidase